MLIKTMRTRVPSSSRCFSTVLIWPMTSFSNSSYPRKACPLKHMLCNLTNHPMSIFFDAFESPGGPFWMSAP